MFDNVKGIAVKGGFFGEESKSLGTILSRRMNIVFGRNGSDRNLYNCPYPFIEVVADDAELPYLRGVAHVRSYAGAIFVIAYADDAQCFRNLLPSRDCEDAPETCLNHHRYNHVIPLQACQA